MRMNFLTTAERPIRAESPLAGRPHVDMNRVRMKIVTNPASRVKRRITDLLCVSLKEHVWEAS